MAVVIGLSIVLLFLFEGFTFGDITGFDSAEVLDRKDNELYNKAIDDYKKELKKKCINNFGFIDNSTIEEIGERLKK